MGSSTEQHDREGRLDALRGIAAFSVAVAHCVTTFSKEDIYNRIFLDLNYRSLTAIFFRFLYIVFNADAAVVIFFVLSGYVLTKSLSRMNADQLTKFLVYIVKRFYRILPTVIVSFIPVAYFIDKPVWEYISNMLLRKVSINGVTWTLQVEIVASFLIFLVFVIKNRARFLGIPFFVLLVALFLAGYEPLFFLYFPAFFLGCYVEDIRKVLLGKEKYLALLATIFLLAADFFLGYATRSTIVVITLASAILVACVPTSTFFRFLDHKIFGFLGKISFSFYLYHFTGALIILRISAALGINLRQMHQVYRAIFYMVTTIPLAIGLATVSYHLVEKPSITAGMEVAHAVERFTSSLFRTKKSDISETMET